LPGGGLRILRMQATVQRDSFYEDLIRPLLFQLDAEDAHNLVHRLLHMFGGVLPSLPYRYVGTDLNTTIGNTTFGNPFGLAAGFDKNAELLPVLADLGFGFAEIGSITARPSEGNPRPRLFRLPDDRALINRLGLNGQGAEVVSSRLSQVRASLPFGINIAKTHDPKIAGDAAVEDIIFSFNKVRHIPAAYVALNASCPNTREGCIEEKKLLDDVLREMQKVNDRSLPILIKVSPDSSEQLISDIIEVSQSNNIAGYICGNTTVTREGLRTPAAEVQAAGFGGLSGPPLAKLAMETTRKIARQKSNKEVVIAVGGISSGEDAYRFIRNGASAVEVYTAFVYKGPSLIRRMCEELSALLKRDGVSLKSAIGADLK
jgi:dihydroorotate dehydrogenase